MIEQITKSDLVVDWIVFPGSISKIPFYSFVTVPAVWRVLPVIYSDASFWSICMVCWISKAIARCATSLAMLLLLGCGGDPLVLVGETVVDNATEVAEEPLADVQVAEDSLSDDSLSDGSIEVVESVADDPVQIADDPIEVASNSLPVVSFVSPGDGETLDFGSLLSVTVNATDSDGSVGSVSLSVDGSLVRQDNTSPCLLYTSPSPRDS